MSKKTERTKLNKAINNREYIAVLMNIVYPIYWDEGVNFYPRYRRGFKNPNKQLQRYEQRKYRTWKYNRKTQWIS